MRGTEKIAVFASGNGSNFHAIAEKMNNNQLNAELVLLVCDTPGAPVIPLAEQYKVPVFVFQPESYPGKEAYEEEIKGKLQTLGVEWIFLAGYMRVIGKTLLDAYSGRMVNLHPSYLPDFPGKNAIEQAIRAKVPSTGVTVHYVDSGIDTGPIIAQVSVMIEAGDTITTLKKRIQQVEHDFYPRVINQLIRTSRNHPG